MKNNKVLTGVLLSVIGLLFIILKGEIISILLTCFGILFIVNGIISIINKDMTKGIIIIVIGIITILFGWLFITIALYVLGALLIVYGIYDLILKLNIKVIFDNTFKKVIYYLIPALYFVAGFCLFFNQGETISFVFILTGIILLINGVLIVLEGHKEVE